MKAVLVPLFVVAVQGFLATTSSFTVSTPLANQTTKLKVAFWDFDKTITVKSFGSFYLDKCDVNCRNYTSYSCTCNATVNYFGDFYTTNFSGQALNGSDMVGLNGTDRRDRFIQTLQHITSKGVIIRLLSTSWAWVRNDSWAYFINEVMKDAGLNQWFNSTNILTLDDPGEGIPADKGGRAKAFMAANGFVGEEGILIDDSQGNINSTIGKLGYLWVQPAAGWALDALTWIEARSDQNASAAPTAAAPSAAKSGAMTVAPAFLVAGLLVFLH
jgi:hypothetical protein